MRPVVSLELTLDPESDAVVRTEWAALAEAGLPSQARHTGESNAPHVTLLVRSEPTVLAPDRVGRMLPLGMRLGAPVLFGTGTHRTLARLVVPSSSLLDLHVAVHVEAGAGDDAPHTRPGEWTPHVTLARRLPLDGLATALAALAARDGIDASAVAVRRWDARSRTTETVVGRGTLEPC